MTALVAKEISRAYFLPLHLIPRMKCFCERIITAGDRRNVESVARCQSNAGKANTPRQYETTSGSFLLCESNSLVYCQKVMAQESAPPLSGKNQ